MKDKHYIWKDVTKNGKTFPQRYYVNNNNDLIESPEENQYDDYLSAELIDTIILGFFYKNIFYDTRGERIQLNPLQFAKAKEKYSDPTVIWRNSDNYTHVLKARRDQFKKLIPLLELKDKLFLKEIEKRDKKIDTLNTLENRRTALLNQFAKIDSSSDILAIKKVCEAIEILMIDTNFEVLIERNDKETTITFKDFCESIYKQKNVYFKPHILYIGVKKIEDISLNMFRKFTYNYRYRDIYQIVNAKIAKMNDE